VICPERVRRIRKQIVAPVMLVSALVMSCVVAAVIGRPVWAAALGAGLVLAYWALDAAVWRRARGRQGLALGTAIGGMVLRLGVVLAVLLIVAMTARASFATAIICFVVVFTLYTAVRLFTFPDAGAPPGRARTL
jgi:hypothetical protein